MLKHLSLAIYSICGAARFSTTYFWNMGRNTIWNCSLKKSNFINTLSVRQPNPSKSLRPLTPYGSISSSGFFLHVLSSYILPCDYSGQVTHTYICPHTHTNIYRHTQLPSRNDVLLLAGMRGCVRRFAETRYVVTFTPPTFLWSSRIGPIWPWGTFNSYFNTQHAVCTRVTVHWRSCNLLLHFSS